MRADSAPARARRGGPANGVASERYRAGCRAGCRDGCRPETCDARGDQAAARVRDAARGRGVVRANAEGSQGGDDGTVAGETRSREASRRDALSRRHHPQNHQKSNTQPTGRFRGCVTVPRDAGGARDDIPRVSRRSRSDRVARPWKSFPDVLRNVSGSFPNAPYLYSFRNRVWSERSTDRPYPTPTRIRQASCATSSRRFRRARGD